MSYILEALKKVERERELEQVPGLHSRHDEPSKRPARRWPWVLAAALLLNAVFIAALWWRGGNVPGQDAQEAQRSTEEPAVENVPSAVDRPSAVSRTPPEPQASAAPASTARIQPGPQTATAPPLEQTDRADAPVPPPSTISQRPLRPLALADPLRPPKPAPAAAGPRTPDAPAVPDPTPPVAPFTPPEIVELRAPSVPSPSQEEPAWKKLPLWPLVPSQIARQVNGRLVLNAHFYSEVPEERFVLLNMKKYTVGEQISEGPNLDEITREGVILAVPDGRFRLEAQ